MAGSNAVGRGVPRRLIQGDGPTVPVLGAGQIPTVQYSTGAAKALQQFSRDMFSISNQFEDQLDQQADAEATTAGAIAGATGVFELQTYGTIRGRAFNKAAVEAYASNLDTAAMVKLNDLKGQFWNDPERLNSEWTNYQNGVASELAKRSPAEALAFKNRNTVRGMPAVEAAKDARYTLTRSEADAALIQNEAALRSEVKTFAADLFSENPERSRAASSALSQVQQQYMQIYNAVDPTTGKPLYSPEEKAKAQKWLKDTTMSNAALSWFDEQTDKAGAYLKFASGDFKVKIAQNNDQVPLVMANKGATRNDALQPKIANQMKAAAAAIGIPGISVVVHSGGQETAEEIALTGRGSRTGSRRHDHGGAGDVRLAVNGKVLDFQSNRETYLKFAENAASAGLTGIGVDEAKGYLHLGGGTEAAWGYRGHSNSHMYLADDFKGAIARGRGQKLEFEPSSAEVSLMDTLSPSALNSLDTEMRQRISFSNQMIDRQNDIAKKQVEATQAKNAFEFTSRIYAAGTTDPTTNQPVRPLTSAEVLEATRNGTLKPSDGEQIIKAMNTERPEHSDEPTLRDLTARIYAGEDVYRMIIDAGSKLSAKDAADLLGKNQSVVRGNLGEFNNDQKYYFNTLNDRLGQTGIFDKFDQGKADRKAQALDEYRRRVMDPDNVESASAIADDIAGRATNDVIQMDQSKLGRMVMPRFSVQVEGQNRIDPVASARALQAAADSGSITPGQFQVEMKRLVDWKKLQDQLDRAQPAKKGK